MFKKQNVGIIFSLLITGLLFLSGCVSDREGSVKISGAFALYPMMEVWAEKYNELNPDVRIDISGGGAGKGMTDAIQGLVDIGMVSREIYPSEIEQGVFWVSVTKDAVVATISADNPVKDILLERGITREQFIDLFINRNITTWGELVGDDSVTDVVRVFSRSDSCGAAQTWAEYLGDYTQDDLTNSADSAINGDPNLAAAVIGDELSIGFNNINFIYDSKTKEPFEGIYPVPIDLNANGVLDENEKVYATIGDITNAIGEGVYPSPPARMLHLVTRRNISEPTADFISWILTDGQEYVPEAGYISLSGSILEQQLSYLEQKTRPELE